METCRGGVLLQETWAERPLQLCNELQAINKAGKVSSVLFWMSSRVLNTLAIHTRSPWQEGRFLTPTSWPSASSSLCFLPPEIPLLGFRIFSFPFPTLPNAPVVFLWAFGCWGHAAPCAASQPLIST